MLDYKSENKESSQIRLKLSDILLRCYECGFSVNNNDLQIKGLKYNVIEERYFHPNCWKKYKRKKQFQELLFHLSVLKLRKIKYCIHCGKENKNGSILCCMNCLNKDS